MESTRNFSNCTTNFPKKKTLQKTKNEWIRASASTANGMPFVQKLTKTTGQLNIAQVHGHTKLPEMGIEKKKKNKICL